MTELVSGSTSIQKLYDNISQYKGSPSHLLQASYDFLEEVMESKVDIVDPTNPFIVLLEMSAVHTAMAVTESLLNLRRSYVSLAQTDEDIYRHMTDDEYVGRFATPGFVKFTFMVELNEINNKLVYDETENCYKGIIPRDTEHNVDVYTFTHEYPIVFRRYPNNVLQITYDVTINSPISTPSNNLIEYTGRVDNNGVRWIQFSVPLKQMKVSTSNYTIQKNEIFNKNIPFTDYFVYARVFNKSTSTNNEWVELKTTHSDQVFDNNTPTAVLRVTTGNLNVTIPYIYNISNLITGSIRIDIYTTKGDISTNLSTYTLDSFSIKYRSIDEKRDTNVYTNVWTNLSMFAYSDQTITGGVNSIDFETIKNKLINYSTGKNQIPITMSRLKDTVEENGFSLVGNVDALTNRIFLAIRKLPQINNPNLNPSTPRLLTTANIGMIRFIADMLYLVDSDNVINNGIRSTLLSNSLFLIENSIPRLIERSEVETIKSQPINSLISYVNSLLYAYTPYYYVLDTTDNIFDVRVYDLDSPLATNLSFIRRNQTLTLAVNTGNYSITKINGGYRLTIVTLSGSFYKQLNDNQVSAQIRLHHFDNQQYSYINGTLLGIDPSGERIYQFDIYTDYDIDKEHHISIINSQVGYDTVTQFMIDLKSEIDIFYTTTSITNNYVPDQTDQLINKMILPPSSVGNTHDKIILTLGYNLENLWTRTRTLPTGSEYLVSETDVPLLYETDIYEINPITGSMLFFDVNGVPEYHKLHDQGDPVLDDQGNQVYKYRVGDPILDNNGNPIKITAIRSKHEIDVLVVDGKLFFSTDQLYIDYQKEVSNQITQWIINDILDIQDKLLERTKIYFYPQSSLGTTKILLENGVETYITSEQTINVLIYVDELIFQNYSIQEEIINNSIVFIDEQINKKKFTVTQIEKDLKDLLGHNVLGVSISNIGGDSDYQAITVSDEQNRLCTRKKLVAQADGKIIMMEDVNITFKSF